jgi:hypothetical protein
MRWWRSRRAAYSKKSGSGATSGRGHTQRRSTSLCSIHSQDIAMNAVKRAHLYREIRQRIGQRPDRRVQRHWRSILHVARRSAQPPASA